jgi:hypothetical protein
MSRHDDDSVGPSAGGGETIARLVDKLIEENRFMVDEAGNVFATTVDFGNRAATPSSIRWRSTSRAAVAAPSPADARSSKCSRPSE